MAHSTTLPAAMAATGGARRATTVLGLATLALLAGATGRPSYALTINPIFDTSITSDPSAAAVENAIYAAIGTIDGLYSNSVTLNVNFSYNAAAPGNLASTNQFFYGYSYASYKAALQADAAANPTNTALATAIANLGSGNDAAGTNQMALAYGHALMLSNYGLSTPSFSANASINLNSAQVFGLSRPVSATRFDAIGVLEHELNEVLGGGGAGSTLNSLASGACSPGSSSAFFCNKFGSLDLYRYSAPGTPSYTTSSAATAYMSVNGGATSIVGFNQNSGGDFADFAPPGTGPGQLIQNAFNNKGQDAAYLPTAPEFTMQSAIGWDPTTPCGFECYNTFAAAPASGGATSFTVVLSGNLLGQIDTTATANDTTVNPFAYVNQLILHTGTSSANVTFDGTNTRITYSGSNPVLPSYSYWYGTNPHFGYQGTVGSPFQLLDQFWGYGDEGVGLQPALGITCRPGGTNFEVFFANVTVGDQTIGEWKECQGEIVALNNPTDFNEILSNVGYYISPFSIPLDLLNFGELPPPGVPDSLFSVIPGFDGLVLTAGSSVTVPEPPAGAILLTALAGSLGLLSRAKRQRRGQRRPSAS